MTEHLELQHLIPFAARLHITRVVRGKACEGVNRSVVGLIEKEADNLTEMPDEDLENNFKYLRSRIEQQRQRYEDQLDPELMNSLSNLERCLQTHVCRHCKSKPKCSRDIETFAIVNPPKGGKCIAPLKKLFYNLNSWVEELWHQVPDSLHCKSLPITLATTHRAFENGQQIVDTFFVGGYARSVRNHKSYRRKVGLYIVPERFHWQQFSVLPYILLHELLCHAYQNLAEGSGWREHNPLDPWSEGWMDTLAQELALEWLRFHPKSPFQPGPELDEAEWQSRSLHEARYKKQEGQAGTAKPSDGRIAYRRVSDRYLPRYAEMRISERPVTKFSLRLNAMQLASDDRLKLLVRLDALAKAEEASADPASRLRELIGDFNSEPDPEAALAALDRALP